MKYYLAYGSNLNLSQMKQRCPNAIKVGVSYILGYHLLFKGSKSGSYLTIEKKDNSMVPVGVYKVTDYDEAKLDRYEGYPSLYYKKEFNITYLDEANIKHKVKAFVYIMDEKRLIGIPSRYYIDTCLKGYSDFGFDNKYLFDAYKISLEECK